VQQLRIGLVLPLLGQEELGQPCSALVWGREQNRQVGVGLGQLSETWPNFEYLVN